MTDTQHLLKDDLIRTWEPYGPVAAYWAHQLADAFVELRRQSACNTRFHQALEAQARHMQDPAKPAEKRYDLALYAAFQSRTKTVKMLNRLNGQADRRVHFIERRLDEIKQASKLAGFRAPGPQAN